MPAIKRINVSTTTNAMNGLEFEQLEGPALVSLYASGADAGDTIGLKVDSRSFVQDAEVNVEASADVVDTDRDAILLREPVPAGKLFVPVTATAGVGFLLVIEEV